MDDTLTTEPGRVTLRLMADHAAWLRSRADADPSDPYWSGAANAALTMLSYADPTIEGDWGAVAGLLWGLKAIEEAAARAERVARMQKDAAVPSGAR